MAGGALDEAEASPAAFVHSPSFVLRHSPAMMAHTFTGTSLDRCSAWNVRGSSSSAIERPGGASAHTWRVPIQECTEYIVCDREACGWCHHRGGTSRFNSSDQFKTTFKRPELDFIPDHQETLAVRAPRRS